MKSGGRQLPGFFIVCGFVFSKRLMKEGSLSFTLSQFYLFLSLYGMYNIT